MSDIARDLTCAQALEDVKNWTEGYGLLLKENTKLHELIRLIFESTVPYNENGEGVFSDKVIDMWKELVPNHAPTPTQP